VQFKLIYREPENLLQLCKNISPGFAQMAENGRNLLFIGRNNSPLQSRAQEWPVFPPAKKQTIVKGIWVSKNQPSTGYTIFFICRN
jgi:hypothetical protein